MPGAECDLPDPRRPRRRRRAPPATGWPRRPGSRCHTSQPHVPHHPGRSPALDGDRDPSRRSARRPLHGRSTPCAGPASVHPSSAVFHTMHRRDPLRRLQPGRTRPRAPSRRDMGGHSCGQPGAMPAPGWVAPGGAVRNPGSRSGQRCSSPPPRPRSAPPQKGRSARSRRSLPPLRDPDSRRQTPPAGPSVQP